MALANKAKQRLGEFNAQELANTAWAFEKVGQLDAALFVALANKAKQRLGSFDHVIIAEAMEETSRFLCDEWHWAYCALAHSNNRQGLHPREMIADDEAYSFFLDTNGPELELYDFAVSLAKQQLKEAGKASPRLDAFPLDSREALRMCAAEAIAGDAPVYQECQRLVGVAYS